MIRRIAALSLVCGLAVSAVMAEVAYTFNGDVMYRFEYNYAKMKDADGEDSGKTGDHNHKYWWNLKAGVAVNENLAFGLRLSNPRGYFTDGVTDNLKRAGFGEGYNMVSIPELYFKWSVGLAQLMGGIIPVAGAGSNNTVMDLVAFETVKYAGAGAMPWFVATNGTQIGLDLLLNFLKSDDLTLGLDVILAVAADGAAGEPAEAMKNDQLRMVYSLPVGLMQGMIKICPVMHTRTNVYRSADNEAGNHSIAGGIDVVAKPVKALSVNAGYAIGGYNNECQEDDANYVATAPMGMVLNAGTKVMPGFGTVTLEFAWGNWKDRETAPDADVVSTNQLYWDLNYLIPVKSLAFRPRMRIWYITNNAENDESSTLKMRPELAFIAKF